ncbi:MAG: filamentous hemagglutinin N-terminal domain-containing protein, partial [Cyanobacteria bacterium J055]
MTIGNFIDPESKMREIVHRMVFRTAPSRFNTEEDSKDMIFPNTSLRLIGLLCSPLVCSIALGALSASTVLAQSIVPANDGTQTQVVPTGNRFDITGGQQSSDGANLFHSFQEFGLDSGEIANFLSAPQTQNIFGRVVGGNASWINGTLSVTGSSANLYLLNPAGIFFGADASLNVPADFTATTATGIGFEGGSMSATDNNSWGTLLGNPNALRFDGETGAIVNEGNLSVGEGRHLGLVGGVVVNTGDLSAEGGSLTLTAVPGDNLVRLSAAGHVLSLEASVPQGTGIAPLSLPELLAGGGDRGQDSQLVVHTDGTVSLVGSGLQVEPTTGTLLVSGTIETADRGAGGTPQIQLLGDRIALLGARVDASGVTGGGNIWIGGEYQGGGTLPQAQRTIVDRQTQIVADALDRGNGGRIIVWATDTTGFFGTIGARGGLAPGIGGQNGGFVEVSGKQNLIFDGWVDVGATQGAAGTLLLDPENITISDGASDPVGVETFLPEVMSEDFAGDDITINAGILESQTGNVILTANNDIQIADGVSLNFLPGGGSIRFTADVDGDGEGDFSMDPTQSIVAPGRDLEIWGFNLTVGNIDTRSLVLNSNLDAGAISLMATGGTIDSGQLLADTQNGNLPGAIDVRAAGNINITGEVLSSSSTPSGLADDGGSIDIESTNGNIFVGDRLDVSSAGGQVAGDAGTLSLRALNGSITTGDLLAESRAIANAGNGGTLEVIAGDHIATGRITTFTDGNSNDPSAAGDVTLRAPNGIILPLINAEGITAGGNVTLDSASGNIRLTGTFLANNGVLASLATGGGNSSGTIDLSHGGLFPFTIGDASANGTLGAITDGTIAGTIEPTTVIYNVPDATFEQGQIGIMPGAADPTPEPTPEP